ncbi:MAG: response regulator transcription factor [Actinomycetota bacterium]
MTKILVVEDDPTMAEMLCYNLRRHGFAVETTSDGTLGLKKARSADITLIVLDLMLPGLDGMQISQELRRSRPDVAILMLTAKGDEKIKLQGFAAGIDDFLPKPFSMDELIARVKALLRRSRAEAIRLDAPDELIFGDLRIVPRDLLAWVAEQEVILRLKEFTLLVTLALEPGRLLSRQDIAEKVWGYGAMTDTRTIDTHVKNLRRKIETPSSFMYIETVRGVGYRFRVRPKRVA